jgi:Rap1a immunity proteins
MINSKAVRLLLVLVLMAIHVSPSVAIERLDGKELLSACQHTDTTDSLAVSSPGRALCSGYVLGYLAGIKNIDLTEGRDDDFRERALRTRASGLLLRDKRLTSRVVCIPEGVSLGELVARINQYPLEEGNTEFADNVIESVLVTHYRCPG